VDLTRALPDYGTFVAANAELGRCLADQGQPRRALAALEQSQRVMSEHRTGWGNDIPLALGLAELCVACGDDLLDEPHRRPRGEAQRACRDALRRAKSYRAGLPEALLLQGRRQWFAGRRGAAKRAWQRGLALARQMGQRYDQARLHGELGGCLGEAIHQRLAERLFEETGAGAGRAQTLHALEETQSS
jgi:hypothetical protein